MTILNTFYAFTGKEKKMTVRIFMLLLRREAPVVSNGGGARIGFADRLIILYLSLVYGYRLLEGKKNNNHI